METTDLKRLFAALSFAAARHRDQRRKDRVAPEDFAEYAE
jgi:hypothetical protein